MITNNYSIGIFRTSSAGSDSAAKMSTPDKTQTSLSSSSSQTQQATADPLQSVEKLSPHGTTVSLTSVSAAEASTHQSSDKQLLEENEAISRDLAKRDREVRNHERIHASIGGAFASAPHLSYQKGPDGQLYAVEGDVRIDTSSVAGDPRATLEKAQVIIRAALSVPEPSVQDKRIAAQARSMAAEASAEIAKLDQPDQMSNEKISDVVVSDDTQTSKKQQSLDVTTNKPPEDDQEDKDSTDKKTVAELNAEKNSSSQAVAASLQEFNNRLNEINKTLRDINLRLVDAGVFEKLFPEGSLIDKNV